eukprot:SAG22_NODE_36_length_27184_cov_65.870076_7_plen_177_part_00
MFSLSLSLALPFLAAPQRSRGLARCLQPPPPPPPTPLYAEPCIRVANTIPTMNNVDIQIVQTLPAGTGRTWIWKNIGFGQFSNWTAHFLSGQGTVNVIDSASQKTLLSIPEAPLTPGPLVVLVKCPADDVSGGCWPPSDKQLGGSVETIAASFVPPTAGSGVRESSARGGGGGGGG